MHIIIHDTQRPKRNIDLYFNCLFKTGGHRSIPAIPGAEHKITLVQ